MHHDLNFYKDKDKDKDKDNYTMNRYVTTNVNHVGFKNRSVAWFTRTFSPILKSYLITYVSKKGAVNRRSLLLSLFVLFISASIASCESKKDEGSANNLSPPVNCDAANIVDIQAPSSDNPGGLLDDFDVDCYKFTINTERNITILTLSSLDTFGRLYTSRGSLIEENDNYGITTNFLIDRILIPGTYYVEVTLADRSGGSYTLSIALPFPDAPSLPVSSNSVCSDAIRTSIPYTPTSFQLRNSQDRDCFKFTLDAKHTIAISTTGSTNTVGGLYDSRGSLIELDDNSGVSRNFLIRRILNAETYYAIVAPYESGGSYTLNIIQIFPDPVCRATVIPSIPYRSSGLRLNPSSNDRACFRFTLISDRDIVISTSSSTSNVDGRLYASSGSLISHRTESVTDSNGFYIRELLSPGTYYVEVTLGRSRISGSYTLHVDSL